MFEFELINGENYTDYGNFSLLITKQLSKKETAKQFGVDKVNPRIVNENGKLGYIDLYERFTMLEEYQLLDEVTNGIVSVKKDDKIGFININDLINRFGYVVVNNNTTMEMFKVKRISKSYELEPDFKTR